MNIEILPPYDTDYNKAYLVTSQGRNSVCLYNSETKKRHTVSYARYLMSTHLGRFLDKDEHVDHIDNDKSNDVITNLQILSQLENNRKQARLRGKKMVKYQCPVCQKVFSIRKGLSHLVSTNKKSVSCSRSCGGRLPKLGLDKKILFLEEYTQYC